MPLGALKARTMASLGYLTNVFQIMFSVDGIIFEVN